ncbi:MAG: putative restriction endonuclease [Moraxellaceae bacterium]|jgi:predicted restriction endonuclease|nr:putative restriction endonuclease [Moraxellaceae bacterium]
MSNWTREQTLVALNLYCQMPFGKIHKGNPIIIEMANRIKRTPSALAMKLVNLASLDPAIIESGRVGLSGASALDREVWGDFQEDPDKIAYESQLVVDAIAFKDETLDELSSGAGDEGSSQNYFSENSVANVVVRRKQNFFRKSVLSSYESKCCMTGVSHPDLLVASHIVPWAIDAHNRLNPANGLCLSALHDKAYDRGLLTVLPDFTIRVSARLRDCVPSPLIAEYLLALEGKTITLPNKFKPDPEFLRYHEKEIFRS